MDLVIAGAGPSGLSLAAAAAQAGLRVTVVDPRAGDRWVPNYGAFVDDLPEQWRHVTRRTWARPRVLAPDGQVELKRTYGLIDGDALQDLLVARLLASGGQLRRGRVQELEPGSRRTTASLEGGERLDAALVVDATGGPGQLSEPGGGVPAHQVAYGELWEVETHPWAAEEMVFMDICPAQKDEQGPSSFLYALPLDARHVFVEETSLAARPPVSMDLLETRLAQRTQALGLVPLRVLTRERCVIAMGGKLPPRDQPVLPFGAAAGLVHPATGYQLCRALHAAPRVARALADHLPGDPAAARAAAWSEMWPDQLLRARHLHLLGLELMLALDPSDLGTFMRCFCTLPAPHQAAYLTGSGSHRAVMAAMAALAPLLPAGLLGEVLTMSAGVGRGQLWSAIRPRLGASS